MTKIDFGQPPVNGPDVFGFDLYGQVQPTSEYADLRRLIEERGLLEKQPVYYLYKITFTAGLLALSITLMVTLNNLWLQLLNAVLLGFAFGQTAAIAHDAGHNQIFESARKNNVTGLFVNFLVAVSKSWWVDQHNQHHRYTNDIDLDPHNALIIVAFSEEQAQERTGILRALIRYQAYYYIPLCFLQAFGMRVISVLYLIKEKRTGYRLELLLMVAHFTVYFAALSLIFNPWHIFLFVLVHQGIFGFYAASIFAPNHKGMPVTDNESRLDFLRSQVTSSRNLKGSRLVDFWYVGLNFQIEHHLFPNMPRNRLRDAQSVVKEFCVARSITYHETGVFQSIKEIIQHLDRVGGSSGARASGSVPV
ncbi:MAG: acyl-CoA desaturase [Chloroflexi bacterium]|nr:acyl-CoA desaturase [Chloroflexota bacterium]